MHYPFAVMTIIHEKWPLFADFLYPQDEVKQILVTGLQK